MVEAFLIATAAGGLAVILSAVTFRSSCAPPPRASRDLVRQDWTWLRWQPAFGLVVVAALACGAIPALQASSPDLSRLRDGARGSTGRRHIGRDVLVVGQTALALVLLIGSALLVESFQRLRNVNPGYDTADIYTFQFATGTGTPLRRTGVGALPPGLHGPSARPARE
jgi:di/tricarboxylate transporter